MTIKCKHYKSGCRNPEIKERAHVIGCIPPRCPFKNMDEAQIYCGGYEIDIKYYVTNGETKIRGPFDSNKAAWQFIRDLKIEEQE